MPVLSVHKLEVMGRKLLESVIRTLSIFKIIDCLSLVHKRACGHRKMCMISQDTLCREKGE